MSRNSQNSCANTIKKDKEIKGKPFVKWVGGKGKLSKVIDQYLPRDIENMDNVVYVDAFVGGGGMLFYMLQKYPNIKKAIINDINPELIKCYEIVRDYPDILIQTLKYMENIYYMNTDEDSRRKFFEQRKKLYNSRQLSDVENAALFIFLNKTCFNGLHRVNKKGEFNVPFGKYKRPIICDEETIRRDSELLKNVEIYCVDYTSIFSIADRYRENGYEVLYYFDPPYRPISKTSCFVHYSKEDFNDTCQIRLSDMCKEIDFAGSKFIASNSDGYSVNPDDTFLLELYHKFNITHLMASRNINAKGAGRGKIYEMLIYNYNDIKQIDQ